jgi:hypothetical protein
VVRVWNPGAYFELIPAFVERRKHKAPPRRTTSLTTVLRAAA